MAKVSIIIPVYNTEKYLKSCIDSVINQTYKDLEIILIDDGSTDTSPEICLSCHDDRIRYICQENKGPSGARNNGLDHATGKYVSFVDSDDTIEPDMVKTLVGIAEESQVDMVLFDFYSFWRNGNQGNNIPGGLYDNDMMRKIIDPMMIGTVNEKGGIAHLQGSIWLRLFKRSVIEDNGLRFKESVRYGEDKLFVIQATLCSKSMFYLKDAPFYRYRLADGSLMNRYIPDLWEQSCSVYHELENTLKKAGRSDLSKNAELFVFNNMVRCITQETVYRKQRSAIFSIRKIREISQNMKDLDTESNPSFNKLSPRLKEYEQMMRKGKALSLWLKMTSREIKRKKSSEKKDQSSEIKN